MPKQYGQECPVAKSLEILGDRWTLLVIRDLLGGKSKFQELLESLTGIAPNILSDRLKLLEESGVVSEEPYSQHPPRVEYKLTDKGRGLGIVIGALFTWGSKHLLDDLVLIDDTCGHEVEVAFFCKRCAKRASRHVHAMEKRIAKRS